MTDGDEQRDLAGQARCSASDRFMALYRPALLQSLKEGYSRRDFTADLWSATA